MTLAAAWCNYERPESPYLWMASDSLISDADGRLISEGVKLFELPVICRTAGPEGFFDQPTFASSVGMVAAGGTLVFQNVYCTLVPLLAHLIGQPGAAPTIEDVAALVGRVTTIYVRSLGQRRPDALAVTIIVAGEAAGGGPLAYELGPRLGDDGLVGFAPRQLDLRPGMVHFIGDRTDDAQAMFRDLAERDEAGASRHRAPLNVIRAFIDDPATATVGGEVQNRLRRWRQLPPGRLRSGGTGTTSPRASAAEFDRPRRARDCRSVRSWREDDGLPIAISHSFDETPVPSPQAPLDESRLLCRPSLEIFLDARRIPCGPHL